MGDTSAYGGDKAFVESLIQLSKSRGRPLTRDQIASLVIPNTPTALTCFAWMDYFFRLVGDFIPNMDEIHLEPCQISEIYAEYVEDRKWAGECSKCVVAFFTCLLQVRTH